MGLSRICLLSLLAAIAVSVKAPADEVARHYFSDTVLLDQNSRPQRFYSDLLRGKTVVIHSFFATCHGVCPVLLGRMKAIQERLGSRAGRDVVLLRITVNSGDDIPAKILDLAASLGAKPGWFIPPPRELCVQVSGLHARSGKCCDSERLAYWRVHGSGAGVPISRDQRFRPAARSAEFRESLLSVCRDGKPDNARPHQWTEGRPTHSLAGLR